MQILKNSNTLTDNHHFGPINNYTQNLQPTRLSFYQGVQHVLYTYRLQHEIMDLAQLNQGIVIIADKFQ